MSSRNLRFMLEPLSKSISPIEFQKDKKAKIGPTSADAPNIKVEATVDLQRNNVLIKNLGTTKCIVNFQYVLRGGQEAFLKPGDFIDFNVGVYIYQLRLINADTGGDYSASPVELTQERLLKSTKINKYGELTESAIKNTELMDEVQQEAVFRAGQQLQKLLSSADIIQEILDDVIVPQTTSISSTSSAAIARKRIRPSDWNVVQGSLGSMPVLFYGNNDLRQPKTKIAAFDLDLTLIRPYGPMIEDWANNVSELWRFMYPTTKGVLQQFFQTNPDYKFIIVTNKAKAAFPLNRAILEDAVLELDLPVIVFAAIEGTEFLKPAPFVWQVFQHFYNGDVVPDWEHSFFVGDSAGRLRDGSKADRLFALNTGMEFRTPEQFFLGIQTPTSEFILPAFIPSAYVNGTLVSKNNDHIRYPNKLEIILMCGCVASGKTKFVETELLGRDYIHINPLNKKWANAKDRLESIAEFINAKRKVVVDRRNIDGEEREPYIKLAKALKVPIRCFVMHTTESQLRHNIKFHEIRTGKLFNQGEVELNLRRQAVLYEKPHASEGIDEVVPVTMVPQNFMSKQDLDIYSCYLLQR